MRQLHVLGVSDDGDALLLGPAKGKASHRLRLDDRLRAAVRGQLSAVTSERAEIALTPKEIQARLRAGESPEEVAKAAQVPVARVLPYAAPVIAERERIVEQARGAVMHRNRGPAGERPLGEVVDAHLGDVAGLKPDSVEWTARRRRDGAWVVLLTYAARGGRRTASWLWKPLERDLTALDVAASRLAVEEHATAKKRPARRPAAAKKAAPKKATRSRPAAKKKSAAKPTKPARPAAAKAKPATRAAKPAAKPARPAAAKAKPATRAAKPAAKPAAAKAKPAKVTKVASVAKPAKPAAKRPTAVPATGTAPRRTRRAAAAPEPERMAPVVRIVPDPPSTPAPHQEPAARPVAEVRPAVAEAQPAAARRGRVPVPSWSDVLLGVAPRHDQSDGSKS